MKWDAAHRSNKENIYCYCGLTGLWKEKMLQCCRCRQWFHENCIKIFNGYLLHGDTFFIFCCSVSKQHILQCFQHSNTHFSLLFSSSICSICYLILKVCNDGNEFIRRLHLSWRDIIHLIFYELTIVRSQKYHSIMRDVVPFILKYVDKIFLPPEVSTHSIKHIKC